MLDMVDRFLASSRWRWGRMAVAWLLMCTGAIMVGALPGFVVTIFGFIPFVESLYDVNLIAPPLGRPLSAARLRGGALGQAPNF